jgi:CHAT domain-containing protein/tetratricopeptide (TPR) repeat protein
LLAGFTGLMLSGGETATEEARRHYHRGEQLRPQESASARREALAEYTKALELWRNAGDRSGQGLALSRIGNMENVLRDHVAAEGHLLEALPLIQESGDRREEAIAWFGVGKARFFRGMARESLEPYQKALQIRQAIGAITDEADIRHNMAAAYLSLGDSRQAFDMYERVLEIRRQTGDRSGLAYVLYAIGLVHWQWGEAEQALDRYLESLEVWRSLSNETGQATTLAAAGLVYATLEQYDQALAQYRQALALWRKLADRGGEGHALNNLGMVYASLRRTAEARDSYQRALALLEPANDPRGRAYVLNNLGDLESRLHNGAKALEDYAESLALKRKIGDRFGEAYTDVAMAKIERSQGHAERAADLARAALELDRGIGDRGGEAAALAVLARAHRDLGHIVEARDEIQQALSRIETARTGFLRRDLRTAYFATAQDAYSLAIDLWMASPSAADQELAIEWSERSRARVLLDSLSELRDRIQVGADAALLARERSLVRQLNTFTDRLERMPATETAATRKKLDELFAALEAVRAEERAAQPRYAGLTQDGAGGLKQMRELLADGRSCLLEYYLGEERGYAWLVTAGKIRSAALPGRTAIAALVERYRQNLAARSDAPAGETADQRASRIAQADRVAADTARELSRILLQPFAAGLPQRVLIGPDGPLYYVPFAALPEPAGARAPMVERHQIVYLPSASVMQVLRASAAHRKRPAGGIAIVADPVFRQSDPRVHAGACPSRAEDAPPADTPYTRLRFSRFEADAIRNLAPAGTAWTALDFDANRSLLDANKLSRYRVLHFATHAEIDNEWPLLSRIVLSTVDAKGCPRDGLIRLYEIYNMHLNADLVVVSGCRTAAGKEVRGEGLIGLTRGFLYAGAAGVAASLWNVEDQATAELMQRFYSALLHQGASPAAALRVAQAGMLHDARWSNPYYWAAFSYQGK